MKVYDNSVLDVFAILPSYDNISAYPKLQSKIESMCDSNQYIVVRSSDPFEGGPIRYCDYHDIVLLCDDSIYFDEKTNTAADAETIYQYCKENGINVAMFHRDGTVTYIDVIGKLQEAYADAKHHGDVENFIRQNARFTRPLSYVLDGEGDIEVQNRGFEPTDTQGYCYEYETTVLGITTDCYNSLYSFWSDNRASISAVLNKIAGIVP